MSGLINLENFRTKYGDENLISNFEKIVIYDKTKAISMIHSQNIGFYTFFLLINTIKRYNLEYNLNFKYKYVLDLYDDIETNDIDNLILNKNQEIYHIFMWIFKTGYKFDGFSNEFDKIIDISAIILILNYNNSEILHQVCALIFNRNRNNLFNHDLIWCYLKSKNTTIFNNIITYLNSPNNSDKEFAHELLSGFTDVKVTNNHNSWNKWYSENFAFMYYSGEHYQLKSSPSTYLIDNDSKFLGIPCSNFSKTTNFSIDEQNSLEELHKYDEKTIKTACCHAVLMRKTKNNAYKNLSVDDKVNLSTKHAKENI